MKLYGIQRDLTVEAIAGVVKYYTGQRPIIDQRSDYTEISFTPEQSKLLQAQLDKWGSKEPGEIRVNATPMLMSYGLKKAALPLAGLFLVGVFIGKMF